MNLYEKCKRCGNKHPSVYRGNVCLNCRTDRIWNRICNNTVEVEYEKEN